jgi:putative hydrolase of the HAD superfamily
MNIVFDFGAVLFDWRPAERVRQRLQPWAATAEQADGLAKAIFAHDDWQAFDHGLLALEQVVDRTASRLGLPQERLHGLMAPIGEELQPIASNVAVLHGLAERRDRQADLRLFFLSNMPAPFARTLEQRHDFLKVFDGGLFSADVQLGKPDPAIYQCLARQYALLPQRTWFIDDHRANVDAACALGWQGLHLAEPQALASLLAAALTS